MTEFLTLPAKSVRYLSPHDVVVCANGQRIRCDDLFRGKDTDYDNEYVVTDLATDRQFEMHGVGWWRSAGYVSVERPTGR